MTFNPFTIETYVMHAPNTGLVKIGRCHPGQERLRQKAHTRHIGEPVRFIGYLDRDEWRALHDLAQYRHHGEWFHPTPEVLDYLKTYGRASYVQRRNQ